MRKIPLIATLLLGGLLGAGLAACDRDGPAERAGEKIDEAAGNVKEGAEKAADKVEDAADDLEDKVEGRK